MIQAIATLFITGKFSRTAIFGFMMLLSSVSVFGAGLEDEKILDSGFDTYFTRILKTAQQGFYPLRGEENFNTLLPSSKEWFPATQLVGTQSCIISDVPQMGMYSYKMIWDMGTNYNKAINLDSQVISAIETALQEMGSTYSKEKMPSRGVEENWLISYGGEAGQGNMQTTVLITLTEGATYKVNLKVIASH